MLGRLPNQKNTYGIVGENGKVYVSCGQKQLFRISSTAYFALIKLKKDAWEELKIVKLK